VGDVGSTLGKGQSVKVGIPGEDARNAKITELFVYENFVRTPVDEVCISTLPCLLIRAPKPLVIRGPRVQSGAGVKGEAPSPSVSCVRSLRQWPESTIWSSISHSSAACCAPGASRACRPCVLNRGAHRVNPPSTQVSAGDICAFSGVSDIGIGQTIMTAGAVPLPTITVEEPTVRMVFMVNTMEFAGQEGKFVTSRNIKDRLDRELERNLALKVCPHPQRMKKLRIGR
jgi:hypothetical protein